jgi:phage-related tail protein
VSTFEIILAGAIVLSSVKVATTEIQATLAGVRATTEALGNLAQEEGREVARLVEKTTAVAERQLLEADRSLDQVRHRIGELSEGLDRSIFEPVRAVLAMAVAVRKGVETLVTARSGRAPKSEEPHDVGPA